MYTLASLDNIKETFGFKRFGSKTGNVDPVGSNIFGSTQKEFDLSSEEAFQYDSSYMGPSNVFGITLDPADVLDEDLDYTINSTNPVDVLDLENDVLLESELGMPDLPKINNPIFPTALIDPSNLGGLGSLTGGGDSLAQELANKANKEFGPSGGSFSQISNTVGDVVDKGINLVKDIDPMNNIRTLAIVALGVGAFVLFMK